jgi:hypothetical protein
MIWPLAGVVAVVKLISVRLSRGSRAGAQMLQKTAT